MLRRVPLWSVISMAKNGRKPWKSSSCSPRACASTIDSVARIAVWPPKERWVAARLLNAWSRDALPPRAQRLDALLALALRERPGRRLLPAWLDADAAALALRLVAPLASTEATVQDSMRVAHVLASELVSRPEFGGS